MRIDAMMLRQAGSAVRSWQRDWGGVLSTALGVLFVGYVVWNFCFNPTDEHKTLVTDIAQPIVSLGMTILAFRASRQKLLNGKKRRAWMLIAIAFLMYFIGNIMWAYYELGGGVDLAVTPADLPYILYYPICLAGLLTFPMKRDNRSKLTFALDASTVMLGASLVIWYVVLRPVAQAEHTSSLEAVVTLAYPVANIVLLFGVVAVLLRRPPRNVGRALRILTLAIFFDATADFGYAYQTLESSYFGGQWPDYFYMLGFVLMAFSAQSQVRNAKIKQNESDVSDVDKSPFSWLPYAAVAVAYGLLLFVAYKFERNHGMEPIVWLTIGAFLITALVVARQIVALRENSRLLAERAARESEARFVALVQHASDVITIVTPGGKLLYTSPSLEPVFGYKTSDLLGRPLLELIHADDKQRAMDAIAAICEGPGKTGSVELRVRHRDESWLDVEAVATNLLHEPNVTGIVVNSRNITERKKAEEALRDSEEKFRQSQKMEAVGQLAGGVAHDFNNLLAVIVGYTDMLLRRLSPAGDERTIRQIEEIQKAGNRATTLTRQLLAFSRKQVLQPKILDLNAVVRDMDNMMRRLIGEHIEMHTRLNADWSTVKADPGQIEQVLMNLVVNARDAMPDGGSLTIETANVDLDAAFFKDPRPVESGPYVMMAVSDTGQGMSAEIQSHIFEPFFTTKEKGKGTGLGLSTVYGIIQQSGGSVSVYSEPGHGTTFKIYLPRVARSGQVAEGKPEKAVPGGNETVLLVEDEESVRHMAHEILQLNGYSVLDASNGNEAVTVSQQHHGVIELMVTDVVMPLLGGRELAEKLALTRPDMRVLYMSGYTDDAIVRHGVLDGRASFLEKPFTPDGFARKIREVLAV
jgi:PAS domain S-box-containing protein